MPVESLGYRTDLFLIRELGEIEQRDGYVVARTPDNPTFYWGNFLLYAGPPSADSVRQWSSDFAREFPQARHVALGWNSSNRGETQAFIDDGFALQELVVLQATRVRSPAASNEACVVRPLETPEEWRDARELGVRIRGDDFPDEEAYRIFRAGRTQGFRRLQELGAGFYYGAFVGDVLAGTLGIFEAGNAARYQQVEVDETFRRRGICKMMMSQAAAHFATTRSVHRFVIVTEVDNHHNTRALYESMGFADPELQWGVCKRA